MVNAPLDVPKAVSDDWRNDSVYSERLWGSYRYTQILVSERLWGMTGTHKF